MEGCRRRLIPGSIPTILKIEPGKQSSKRQHRKVSLVQFYLSFSIVSAMKFSFSWKYPICLFPDISAICKYILKSLIKFSIVHIAALLYFSFLSLLFIRLSHVARSEDAGLPKSFSMVSKVFKSTVNNLLFFFSQTQVSISTFCIDHK